MKVDCNVTKNYFKEKKRMTGDCKINCENCPISGDNNKTDLICEELENTYPDKAIEIVQRWSDEHQVETRAEHFMKMFPNAQVFKNGYPFICVKDLNKKVSCEACKCEMCWDEPYTEGEF